MNRIPVLIVGGGPSGLVLASWLQRQNVGLRIIDKGEFRASNSRAIVMHARSLELYQKLGLADEVIADGKQMIAANLWIQGKHRVRLPIGDIGKGVTPYPFVHVYPQDRHEKLLEEKLAEAGITVERNRELVNFKDHGDHVSFTVLHNDTQEREENCEAQYIIGCDGASSTVRNGLSDIHFPGGTYQSRFYVADIEASGPAINGEVHVSLHSSDFLLIFAYNDSSRVRVVGMVDNKPDVPPETLTFEDVSGTAIDSLKIKVEKVNWFSTYRVHHRVASKFRSGRAFLVGDAGHIHSPAGGQGMNTGIGDAVNLAWKLAAVLQGHADPSLLDSFEEERIPFARALIQRTDQAFSIATSGGFLADIARSYIVPWILPVAMRLPGATDYAFRILSQTHITYRGTSCVGGVAGHVHGGDRLPYTTPIGLDNYEALSQIAWQVHVYGTPKEEMIAWCRDKDVALHAFDWTEDCKGVGFARDAAYLLRPDSYVAFANLSGMLAQFEEYLGACGIRKLST
ncbi:monooxygenase [Histoplasma capsulatum G186AR]|uniref:Monooxygenase n=2 Tax=Ajellomyces capsulatus TaxID=5037 RepID=C0NQC2_AJECG|nr:monooxygenase [Histoplasma capsulatum G186AR]EEH06394.1 monooxygenase [Histoplasma capsulatum G186AR]KAG5293147.1 monooxygenase [Histoplasma capsulatum]QSS74598.1 monooxygenase [Histoplasma capsulatum G186AR]